MSGKRLLDLAALLNASRGVAQKHIALRTRQVEVYNRTSSLTRAVRNQTERVTETAKAASFLVSRLDESAPAWTSEAQEDKPSNGGPIPSRESAGGSIDILDRKSGLEQDHFYKRSSDNSAVDEHPTKDLHITQEKASRYPLPDGTIPPEESDLNTRKVDHDTISTRPRDETSKEPLGKGGLRPASSIESTIPSPTSKPLAVNPTRAIQQQSEPEIPSNPAYAIGEASSGPLEEGHDEESFYRRTGHTSLAPSSLPRVKIPEYPSNTQKGDSRLPKYQINSDSYYSAGGTQTRAQNTRVAAVQEQEQIPEDVNTDLFYSPRVARMLRGTVQDPKITESDLTGRKESPVEKTISAEAKDQHTFDARISPEKELANPKAASTSKHDPPLHLNEEQHFKNTAEETSRQIKSPPIKIKETFQPESGIYELRESKVPSSRIGRLWNYGGLAAGMFGGAITESLRRVSGSGGQGSYMLSSSNMDRLVSKLSKMRGAALKLGQMISFQDSKMLPAPIQEVLQRVQDRADYMPISQRNKVLISNLGAQWRELFSEFEDKPLAAASIGQVHSATLKSNGARVAVKVQYPGVSDSIDSDLNNLAVLLTASRLLPKGLFLDKTIANARTELAWECDYVREAECGRRFEQLLADEKDVFLVPKVYPEASGKQVLTMEFMDGVGVTRVGNFSQEQKDWIGTQILRLCLREIMEFKYMQTDPNWTNFLYNAKTKRLELLDFGASREYPDEFITRYSKLLAAASRSDEDTVRTLSIELGYLTGHESKTMLEAHIASVLTLAEPFLDSSPDVYDFQDQTITERVRALIPVMIRERLAPPPEETYSLHRKLSGAFLLCARLGSRVKCRELFQNSMAKAGLL